MTDRATIERLLHDLHAARVRGDLAAMSALYSDRASFRISGAGDVRPIAVSAQGLEALRPWLALMVKTFRLTDYALVAMLIDGERSAVHWRVRIHSKITGSVVPTELVDLVEVHDGRIATYTEFFVPG
jgi:ketosteroid isomerase-like protein